MSSAVPQQSTHGASSSSSTTASRVNPSPPMTPGRQQATPPSLLRQPFASSPAIASSLAVHGRNRELQQLYNEIQLLEEELKSLDNIPPASKACKDLVTYVENRSDPFFPNRGLMIDLSKPHAVVGSFNDMLSGRDRSSMQAPIQASVETSWPLGPSEFIDSEEESGEETSGPNQSGKKRKLWSKTDEGLAFILVRNEKNVVEAMLESEDRKDKRHREDLEMDRVKLELEKEKFRGAMRLGSGYIEALVNIGGGLKQLSAAPCANIHS